MDDLDLDRLEKLVAAMRRLGVRSAFGVEVWAEDVAKGTQPQTAAEAAALAEAMLGKEPPPEDMLLWSVDGPLPSETSDASRPPEE